MAIHKFVKAIFNGEEITVFGDRSQTRYFTFVDDAVEANILAAESDSVGEVFNIGGGSRISVNDLVTEIEKIVGNKARMKYIEKQKGDVLDTWADVSKAEKKMNWNTKINIHYGLRNYIKWYIYERKNQ